MKMDRQNQKQLLQGCLLTGIYAQQLHVSEDLVLFSSEFLLKFKNPVTSEVWYWKVSWIENEELTDHLMINEQKTPDPLEYVEEPVLSQHAINASLFTFEDNVISRVSGYGFQEKEVLNTIVFAFEESYLYIKTGPLIEARYMKSKPNNLGECFISFN